MSDEMIVRLQAGHASYRAVELRAQGAVDAAREDAARVLAELRSAGGDPIDADLPTNPTEAAAVLDRRSYELTNEPRRAM